MIYEEALKIRDKIHTQGMACIIWSDRDTGECHIDIHKNQYRASAGGFLPIASIYSVDDYPPRGQQMSLF